MSPSDRYNIAGKHGLKLTTQATSDKDCLCANKSCCEPILKGTVHVQLRNDSIYNGFKYAIHFCDMDCYNQYDYDSHFGNDEEAGLILGAVNVEVPE